ncbi:MAG TPA: succinate dehydrogenase/fumarate reductase iron-sulfur subunit [Polyangiaceae bacterium]|jgi:succinate dehydrogenase / fumarate reductase iron-sulfur subunit|nr:succinate dehydrogenase/fumarate reductase iron-sulfur subunit [Polyangiaceae bacterium]
MNLTLRIWRQRDRTSEGRFERYAVEGIDPTGTLLDALDMLNERLVREGERPVAFDSDCREGICGMCGVFVDGLAHGGIRLSTTCEVPVRGFPDGEELTLEPFRTGVFGVVCDLVVDRSALDRVMQSGGYVSTRTGSAPDGNALPVAKDDAEQALDAAACIGCGACVAACPNGAASLFAGAKLAHLGALPQGAPERARRALAMTRALDDQGFGGCSLHGECERACPKGIEVSVIARMNGDVLRAVAAGKTQGTR